MPRSPVRAALLALALRLVGPAAGPAAAAFVTFESGHVRPLALSPDGTRLFAVNTPDDRLEIFAVDGTGGLTHTESVPVGMEPVAVAARTDGEVWVVNHLSDSVSIVDVGSSPPRVTRTLLVGDEPRDIVFAGPGGNRAFVTTAHRGQNSGVPLADLTTEGIGRADVWVFDALALGATLGGTPLTILELFGDTPRALAVSPDGNTVYAAVFHSGNRTTTVSEGAVCDGGAGAGSCSVFGFSMPGGLPLPSPSNCAGEPQPEAGLIVKFDPAAGEWRDPLARTWNNAVRFSLPDYDVFAIDAAAGVPAPTGTPWAGVGTILFNMAVNPVSGRVYVSNTEARNEVRFEGPGGCSTTVRGHLHEARVTVLDGATVTPRHLNKHITYALADGSAFKPNSLATPLGMAVTPDGATLYVAAFGSSKVGVFDTTQLENDTFTPNGGNYIPVSGGGPSGVLVRGSRLYVSTRFDNAISVVDTGSKAELQHLPVHSPEPTSVKVGRPVLYDAVATSSNGEAACAACHVFADFDSLAWDLGNPDDTTLNNPNPIEFNFGQDPDFKPLKGPMTTQSLRGMANHGPMHWRGDRTGGNDPGGDPLDENAAFNKFIVAFQGLLGRTGPIATADMQKFADFILQVTYPPNPIRSLDNTLTAEQQAGRDIFVDPTRRSDTVRHCAGCHTLDPAAGFFGTKGFTSFENETQLMKIPHLRNLYQKVGMFGMPQVPFLKPGNNGDLGDQVRGFGFLHDGSVDTLFRFHRASVFDLTVTEAEDMERFVLAFDSNLAPIVGQQITLTSTNGVTVGPRIDLMIARAAATPSECDVVVKGVVLNGTIREQRGAYRLASGSFRSDRASEPLRTDAALRGLAATAGQELTYTCAPPGSGVRMGVDRDGDGYFDRDEIDAGSDPADPASLPPGGTTTSTTSPTTTSTSTTSTTLPASGQAISGRKLVLVDDPADASRRKAKAASRDPGIDVGLGNGSADDPVLHGALVGIFSAAGGFAGFYPLPASNWRHTGTSTNPGYKYVDKLLANGPIKVAVVKSGKLVKVSGRGAVLNLSLAANPDPVSVQLVLGASKLYCMSFGGTPTFTASKKYVAREAPAPATCP